MLDDCHPTLLQFGDIEVFVEATELPGYQPAAGHLGAASRRVADAFDGAWDVITRIGEKVATAAEQLSRAAGSPDELEVQFGIKLATSGHIVIASTQAEANLAVKLTYRRDRTTDQSSS